MQTFLQSRNDVGLTLPVSYLKIHKRPIFKVDPLFSKVQRQMRTLFRDKLDEEQRQKLKSEAALINKVTKRLNRQQLDFVTRELLSNSDIYQYLLYNALFPKENDDTNPEEPISHPLRILSESNNIPEWIACTATLFAWKMNIDYSLVEEIYILEGEEIWLPFINAAREEIQVEKVERREHKIAPSYQWKEGKELLQALQALKPLELSYQEYDSLTVDDLKKKINKSPLLLASVSRTSSDSPNLSFVNPYLIYGLYGDWTDNGTWVQIFDPDGAQSTPSFMELSEMHNGQKFIIAQCKSLRRRR